MMEPTHLVYEAWKRTNEIVQNTKDAGGNEIVTHNVIQD